MNNITEHLRKFHILELSYIIQKLQILHTILKEYWSKLYQNCYIHVSTELKKKPVWKIKILCSQKHKKQIEGYKRVNQVLKECVYI